MQDVVGHITEGVCRPLKVSTSSWKTWKITYNNKTSLLHGYFTALLMYPLTLLHIETSALFLLLLCCFYLFIYDCYDLYIYTYTVCTKWSSNSNVAEF